ncbi:MAG: antibiotic biosynthesis monooxygenase [Burkholderiales bacterium]|nr:antibiotic biosynthesis monooxygenase [Burkholderiales bacterium]
MLRRLMLLSMLVFSFGTSSVVAQDSKIVLINVFEVPAAQEVDVFRIWTQSKEFLEKQPGYVLTRLHKNIDSDGKFRFINVAEWASPQQFQAAMKAMNESAVPRMPAEVRFTPGLFKVVAQ